MSLPSSINDNEQINLSTSYSTETSCWNEVSKDIENMFEVSDKKHDEIPPTINYGKVRPLYFVNNNPWFTIGPDIWYFIIIYPINLFFVITLHYILWDKAGIIMKGAGFVICLTQSIWFLLTVTINPGLPKAEYQLESYRNNLKKKENFRRCRECLLWINCNTKTYHCFECNICVEGYDHHCPWMTKCVARGNLYLFYSFLFFTFFTISYFFACAWYLSYTYTKS